jgi:gluconokinase
MVVITFGVAGAGKTTIGELLAQELGWKFYDADDFHSAANIDKMQRGIPLTGEDRQPWLETLRKVIEQSLAENDNVVLACSALKKKYRDRLRVNGQVKLVFLRGSRDRIAEQLKRRREHFVDPKLLDSQFADLEEPKPSEHAVTVELGDDPPELVQKIKASLRERSR